MIDMRRTRSTSPGQRTLDSREEARVDLLDDLQMPRHDALEQPAAASVSSASGSSVWLVYAKRARAPAKRALEGQAVLVDQQRA